MPITLDEFETGYTGASYLIFQFLRSNEGLAFALEELRRLEGLPPLDNGELEIILDALVLDGKLERKQLRGVLYFSYRKRREGFRLP